MTTASSYETGFEKKRGIISVEIRQGYSQVHVMDLEPTLDRRLAVLDAVAHAQISLDFLKLTTDGLSFLIPADRSRAIVDCLSGAGYQFELNEGRSIVMVHAVNMRDEEGLIAKIVATAIGSGAHIDHLGDMHDRLLIVTEDSRATDLANLLQERLSA
ncbi:MAG: hypothetical protein K1X67_02740 [Fimbriimonadaceae bacterium]|nr:hypothetical protein [Fimbriimonadaceae bacterium]